VYAYLSLCKNTNTMVRAQHAQINLRNPLQYWDYTEVSEV